MSKKLAAMAAIAALSWTGGVSVQDAVAWHIPNPPHAVHVTAEDLPAVINGSIDILTTKSVDCSGITVWAANMKGAVAKAQAVNGDAGCMFSLELPAVTPVSLYATAELSWLANNGLTQAVEADMHKPQVFCNGGNPCKVMPDGFIVLTGKIQVIGLNLNEAE